MTDEEIPSLALGMTGVLALGMTRGLQRIEEEGVVGEKDLFWGECFVIVI